jgi:hypothetical protein
VSETRVKRGEGVSERGGEGMRKVEGKMCRNEEGKVCRKGEEKRKVCVGLTPSAECRSGTVRLRQRV